jgi:hypothetical protein
MNKLIPPFAIVAVAFASAPAVAIPDNRPINAAQVTDELFAEGCWVRANDTDPYEYDPVCESHAVITRDREGNIRSVVYEDNSALLAGQAAPGQALRYTAQFDLFGLSCSGSEVITPSGEYRSHLHCR